MYISEDKKSPYGVVSFTANEYYDETSINFTNCLGQKKVKTFEEAIYTGIMYAKRFKNKGMYQITIIEQLSKDVDNRFTISLYHKTNKNEYHIFNYTSSKIGKIKFNFKDKISSYSYPISESFLFYNDVHKIIYSEKLKLEKKKEKANFKREKNNLGREFYVKKFGDSLINHEKEILSIFSEISYPQNSTEDDSKKVLNILKATSKFSNNLSKLLEPNFLAKMDKLKLCICRKDQKNLKRFADYSVSTKTIRIFLNKYYKDENYTLNSILQSIAHEYGHHIDDTYLCKNKTERKFLLSKIRETNYVRYYREYRNKSSSKEIKDYCTYRLKGEELLAEGFATYLMEQLKLKSKYKIELKDFSTVIKNSYSNLKIIKR